MRKTLANSRKNQGILSVQKSGNHKDLFDEVFMSNPPCFFFQRESDLNFRQINPKWTHFSSGNFYKSTRISYRQAKSNLRA